MNWLRSIILVWVLTFAFQVYECENASGWDPIAHYEITKKAGYADVAPYAQLPDYVTSYTLVPPDISRYFCWSHAVQDAGTTSGIPLAPTYPHDGRYPGPLMWYLANHKLPGLSQTDKSEMKKTAEGFVAHNAADRIVHFLFFLGPHAGEGPVDALNEWRHQHRDKERWADYQVFFYLYSNGKSEDAFDSNGHLVYMDEQGNTVQYFVPVAPPTTAMERIMQLAQDVSCKNRRFTEANQPSYNNHHVSVQTESDIGGNIQGELVAKNTITGFQKLYNKADYETLKAEAEKAENNWQVADVIAKYNTSKTNVKTQLDSLLKNGGGF